MNSSTNRLKLVSRDSIGLGAADAAPPVIPPPFVPPTATPLALPTDHEFFICSSTVLATAGANAVVVSDSEVGARAALDQFLSGLSTGMLAIAAAPDAGGQPLLQDTADFPDDLFMWFKAVLQADNVLAQEVHRRHSPDL
jgi:hypothetical protein